MIKRKQKDREIPGSCQRAKKAVKHESDDDINCNWSTWYSPQRDCEDWRSDEEIRTSRTQLC